MTQEGKAFFSLDVDVGNFVLQSKADWLLVLHGRKLPFGVMAGFISRIRICRLPNLTTYGNAETGLHQGKKEGLLSVGQKLRKPDATLLIGISGIKGGSGL